MTAQELAAKANPYTGPVVVVCDRPCRVVSADGYMVRLQPIGAPYRAPFGAMASVVARLVVS